MLNFKSAILKREKVRESLRFGGDKKSPGGNGVIIQFCHQKDVPIQFLVTLSKFREKILSPSKVKNFGCVPRGAKG